MARRVPPKAFGLALIGPALAVAAPFSPGADLGPAAAPWWPPTANAATSPAGPTAGWAMSKAGPMMMPPRIHTMVYGPASALADGPRLQKVLAKVWEHLASRVDDLEDADRRAQLLREETEGLRRKGLAGQTVLVRIEKEIQRLWGYSRSRSEELKHKFAEVHGFRGGLKTRFPASRKQLEEYFDALRDSEKKVGASFRSVGRLLTKSEEDLGVAREVAAKRMRRFDAEERGLEARVEALAREEVPVPVPPPAPPPPPRPIPDLPPPPPPVDLPPLGPPPLVRPDADFAPPPPPPPVARGGRGYDGFDPIEAWEHRAGRGPAGSGHARVAPPPRYEAPEPDPGPRGYEAGGSPGLRNRSAKELLRERYARLKRMTAAGKTTRELEAEMRSRRARGIPPQLDPDRRRAGSGGGRGAGGMVAPDADAALEEFLEKDTVMDPYLSKAPDKKQPRLLSMAPEARGAPPASRRAPAPAKAGDLGHFAKRLDRELQLAANTEGLDPRRSFSRGAAAPRPAPPPAPGPRKVSEILAELDALADE